MLNQNHITHMKAQGLDLTSYDDVKGHAGNIYAQVTAGNTPPDNPWPQGQITKYICIAHANEAAA